MQFKLSAKLVKKMQGSGKTRLSREGFSYKNGNATNLNVLIGVECSRDFVIPNFIQKFRQVRDGKIQTML